MAWDLEVGDVVSRTALQGSYGGSPSRGISAPARASDRHDIMLWWHPEHGERFGYRDGWSKEGLFYFTGTGQDGDQTFEAPLIENARVRDHRANGDRLRLLRYIAKNSVRYLGEVELADPDGYVWLAGEDDNGITRRMVQFRLRPVGAVLRERDDVLREGAPEEPTTEPLPEPPPEPTATDLEALNTVEFGRREAARKRLVVRRERLLVQAFGEWLRREHNLTVTGLVIPYAPEQRPLRADAFVAEARVLIEAKATTDREAIRTAIGQLLDYARYLSPRPRLCILTPNEPARDMVGLVEALASWVPFEWGLAWRSGRLFATTPELFGARR